MTYEEAHSFFEEKQHEMTVFRGAYSERQIAANGKAIEALEKQIPKKPSNIVYRDNPFSPFIGRCTCGEYATAYDEYCRKCGQRLDWWQK